MKKLQLLIISILFLLPYTAKAAIVTVSGIISTNTTWTSGNTYHITSTVTLNSGVTLTVEPGTVIKFNPGTQLTVNGTLLAGSNSGTGVVFTSRDDDTYGDILGTSDHSPIKGDWMYLNINQSGSNASVLENVIIRYSQYGVYFYNSNGTIKNSLIEKTLSYGVNIYASSGTSNSTIQGNTISESNGIGMYISYNTNQGGTVNPNITGNTITNNTGVGLYALYGNPSITNNTITNNGGKGLDCRVEGSAFTGNSFSGNGSPSRFCTLDAFITGSTNTYSDVGDYIEVQSFNILSTTATLPDLGKSIVVYGGSLTSGKTLTVLSGNIFRMGAGAYIYIYGNLQAIGTVSEPIVFTSRNDIDFGGSLSGITNGTPTKGDWGSLNISQSTSNVSVLDNVIIKYAQQGVYFVNSNATLKNSLIENTSAYGVNIYGSSSPLVQGNTISGSNGIGMYVSFNPNTGGSLNPTITGNTITNNTGVGLYALYGNPGITNNTITNNGGKGLDCRVEGSAFTGNSFSGNASPSRFCTLDPILEGNPSNTTYSDGGDYVEVQSFNILSTNIATIPNVGKPIVVYGGSLSSGKALTISPGNTFRIGAGASIQINGNLQAIGTVSEPIVFTSKNDIDFGGSLSGITTGTPTKGDWMYLNINQSGSNASVLENVVIRYAQQGVYFVNSNATVRNSIIENTSNHGIYVYAVNGSANPIITSNIVRNSNTYGISVSGYTGNGGATTNPVITNNTITNNTGGGAYLYPGLNYNTFSDNIITNNGSKGMDCNGGVTTFSGNTYSGNALPSKFCTLDPLITGSTTTYSDGGDYIEVQNFNIVSTNTGTIPNIGKPIVIYGGTLASGKTLTISPGNIFRVGTNAQITVFGNLQAIGTVSETIVFTSINDNEFGGSVIGSTGTPAKGNWSKLYIANSGTNSTVLDNVRIRYATRGVEFYLTNAKVQNSIIEKTSQHAVYFYGWNGGTPTVKDSILRESNEYGFYKYSGGEIILTGNTITSNTQGGVYVESVGSTTKIKNNILYGNGYGVRCGTAIPTQFKYNLINGNTSGRQNGTNCTLDSTNLDQDPLFVNYAGGDYSLQAGSSAIDAGDPSFGNHPLSGNTYDMGAIEFINGIVKVSSAAIYNPEGKTLTYTWSFIADPTSGAELPVFSGVSSGITSSVNANVSVAFILKYVGNYTLKLTITEGGNPVITNSYNFTVQ